jgi:hypothetical protein
MQFPPLLHDLPHQLSHVHGNILQDSSVTRSGQLMKVTQLLAPFVIQHAQKAFYSQYGKIVIQLPNGIWHGFHFPGNLFNHFLYLHASAEEGQTTRFNFIK